MKSEDFPRLAKLMVLMSEYYRQPLNELIHEMYWKGLKKYEFEQIEQAFWHHVHVPRRGQWMPKISDFVDYIEGDYETRSLNAWTKVIQAIRQIGAYDTVVFDDELIHAVIRDMGGWVHCCSMTLEQQPFKAHEFQKRYQGYYEQKLKRVSTYLGDILEKSSPDPAHETSILLNFKNTKKYFQNPSHPIKTDKL